MFKWLKARISKWVDGVYERKLQRLTEESRALKAEVIELNGGKPIVLSAEERASLREASKGIDPERLKQISVFDPEEYQQDEYHPDSN